MTIMPVLDWSLLKKPLLILAACCVIALGLAMAVETQSAATDLKRNQIRQAFNLESEKLKNRREGVRIYKNVQAEFRIWYGERAIKSDKLSWMEQLQLQAENLILPAMAYSIKARQPNKINATLTGGVSVYSTPIELQAGLVHEGQLLSLFKELKEAGLGLFSIDYCKLALIEGHTVFKPAVVNINSTCILNWHEVLRSSDVTDSEAML